MSSRYERDVDPRARASSADYHVSGGRSSSQRRSGERIRREKGKDVVDIGPDLEYTSRTDPQGKGSRYDESRERGVGGGRWEEERFAGLRDRGNWKEREREYYAPAEERYETSVLIRERDRSDARRRNRNRSTRRSASVGSGVGVGSDGEDYYYRRQARSPSPSYSDYRRRSRSVEGRRPLGALTPFKEPLIIKRPRSRSRSLSRSRLGSAFRGIEDYIAHEKAKDQPSNLVRFGLEAGATWPPHASAPPKAAKADVNAAAADSNGRTALQTAAGGGHVEVVERLLAAKADVNAAAAKWRGLTALQAAAGGGHVEVVERLLAAKADVNAAAAYSHGRTALQAAAEGGHVEVVERLLAAKADVNAAAAKWRGLTALQSAAGGGHVEVVEGLLDTVQDTVYQVIATDTGERALVETSSSGEVSGRAYCRVPGCRRQGYRFARKEDRDFHEDNDHSRYERFQRQEARSERILESSTVKVNVVCDACRMRRIQCNGQEPCIACAAFNVECTFSKPTSGSEWTSKSDEELASYNYEENLRRYGSKHEETMEALDRLTELLVLHKKFAEAESLEVKALLLKTETFGPEHHDTIRSMHRLVQSWKELGRLTEAEELGQKLIVAQGRLRGEGHSETLHSMYEQADTLQQLRKWPQAETLCMILLDKSLNRLGVKDPLTLQTSALLMSVLRKQGKEAEAERARSLLDRSQPFAGGSFLDLFETSGKPRQDSQLFQDDPDDGAAESRMSGRDATWSSGGGSSSRGIGSSDFGTSGLSEAFEHGLRGLGTQRGRRRDDENPAEVFWCRVGDESCPRTIGKRSYDVEMHRDMHEQDCTRRMESRRTASLVPLPANPFAPLQRSATMPARAALERSESGGGDEGDDDERESSLDDGFEAERRQMEEERRQLAVLRAEIARERAELEELRRQRA